MKKNIFFALVFPMLVVQSAFALMPRETSRYFNGPTVSNITSTGATLSLSDQVLAGISSDERSGIYFEYIETHMACIAIYPTPESCLPKKTTPGTLTVKISNLKPNTSYTAKYKRDNTIRCITTPCPGNEFESLSVEFTTSKDGVEQITKNLRLGMKDVQVAVLQRILIEQGYLNANATGFFGFLTRNAVINYQKMHNILASGYVGPITRASFLPVKGEYFEGIISAYSTQCFVDGICSVTVGDKVVVITRGWARDPVGTLQGVESIADVGSKIGAHSESLCFEDGRWIHTLRKQGVLLESRVGL
jgi:hypothetical protein